MEALTEWAIVVGLSTFTVVGGWLLVRPAWYILDRLTRPLAKGLSYFFMYLAMAGDRADAEIVENARKIARSSIDKSAIR